MTDASGGAARKEQAMKFNADKDELGAVTPGLPPFDWYKELVPIGAWELRLPVGFIETIEGVRADPDPDSRRAAKNRITGNRVSIRAMKSVHGIDFSGNERMWRPGCQRSNVWIATAELRANRLELVALRPVQDLPGTPHPFNRLAAFLAEGDYCAAAIDAPFSLPARHMPEGGFPSMLRNVAAFQTGCRPFAKGQALIDYGKAIAPLQKQKPLRMTEQVWSERGVNIRSTLWNGPRGGAPFTMASLTLLAQAKRPVWPWNRSGPGMLVESFPAGQLCEWNLPYKRYDGLHGFETRAKIIDAIAPCIRIPGPLHRHCGENADALDSVLCLFSAKAAAEGSAPVEHPAAAESEGWIAVHPA